MFPLHAYTEPEAPKTNGVARSFGISASPGPISYPVYLDKQFNLSETHFLWHKKKKGKKKSKSEVSFYQTEILMRVSICMCGRAPERLGTLEKRYVIYPKLFPPFPYQKDPENVSVDIFNILRTKKKPRNHPKPPSPSCCRLGTSLIQDPVFIPSSGLGGR